MKSLTKVLLSIILGSCVGAYYVAAYGFSLEIGTICAILTMIFMMQILNLKYDALQKNGDGGSE